MVLVLKRDRFGNWWRKNGGVDYGWTAMTPEEAALYERAASKSGHLEELR
jgi:hypothetical protein